MSIVHFPLSLSEPELDALSIKVANREQFAEEEYVLLEHIIHNAKFWKSKYKQLTEDMRKFYEDEQISIVVD